MPRKSRQQPPSHNGLVLSDWQSQDHLVQWARSNKEFSLLLSLVQNHQASAASSLPDNRPDASIRQAGRIAGWSEVLSLLLSCRQYPGSAPAQQSVTYGLDAKDLQDLNEVEQVTD